MAISIERLNPATTAVIVVDMQNDFVAPGAALYTEMGRNLIPRLTRLLRHARESGMKVIYTAHAHRRDGSDMGLFGEIWSPIEARDALVDDTVGIDIVGELAPKAGELVIKKHRYSAFFGTDLDIVLRTEGIENVVVTGVTTENCCHATARDAMFRGYRVAFVSDATGTADYPDVGQGAVPAEEVHRVTLAVLSVSTADVMTVEDLIARTIPDRQQASA